MEGQMSVWDYVFADTKHVEVIDYEDTKPFILNIHYARRMPCIQYAFGLREGGRMIGVVTYGQPASPSLCKGVAGEENRLNVLELNRLVILPEYNGKNYASYLVGHSLKMLPNKTFVVSYADWGGWGHVGYVYQATNWLYTGITKERTDIYSEAGHSRHYSKDETRRQPRTAKHRYIYLVGDKSTRKQMKNDLKYKVLNAYPKGDSRHYDTNEPVGKLEDNGSDFDFETFRDYCKHQSGSIKFGDDEEASRGCTFKDERSATCWDDWQKCNEQNCPFMKKMKGEL